MCGSESSLWTAATQRLGAASSGKEERMEASLPLARKLFTQVCSLHYTWGSPAVGGSPCGSHSGEMGILGVPGVKKGPQKTQTHSEPHNQDSRNQSSPLNMAQCVANPSVGMLYQGTVGKAPSTSCTHSLLPMMLPTAARLVMSTHLEMGS